MAFVTPKNVFSPLTNKTVLFLWIFIALLFAVMRSSGAKLTVHNVQPHQQTVATPQNVPQASKPQIPSVNQNAKDDSYLPFGFNELNKKEEQPKKPSSKNNSLNDLLQQLD